MGAESNANSKASSTVEEQLEAAFTAISALELKVKEQDTLISGLSKENEKLVKRVNVLENTANRHDNIQKRQDIEKSRCAVILKGINLHKQAIDGKETPAQTMEVVKSFLGQLEIANELGIYEPVRFRAGENAPAGKPPIIKLNVSSVAKKAKLYEALSKDSKGKKKVKGIAVQDSVPEYLKESQKKLEKIGFEMRKATANLKTRIFIQGLKLVLKCKGQGEEKFAEADVSEYEEKADEEIAKDKANKKAKSESKTEKDPKKKAGVSKTVTGPRTGSLTRANAKK